MDTPDKYGVLDRYLTIFHAICFHDSFTNAIDIYQTETGSSVRSTSAATGGLPGSICVQWRWTDDPGATSDGDESSINNTSTRYKGNEHPAGVGTQIDGLFTTRSALMLLGPETGGASDPQDRENADAASIISFCVRASKAVAMKRGAAQLKVGRVHYIFHHY